MGANGSQLQLFTVATFFEQLLVRAAEKSISLLHMTIPPGVRWVLGSTMIHSITTLRNFNNMPKISRRLKSSDQHSLS